MDRERRESRRHGATGQGAATLRDALSAIARGALPSGSWPARGRRLRWHLGTLVWLGYLAPWFFSALSGPVTARDAEQVALLTVFVISYVYVLARPPWSEGPPLPGRGLVVAVMALVVALLVLHFDPQMIGLLIFFDVAWVMLLSLDRALAAVLLGTAVAAAVSVLRQQDAGTVALNSFQTLVSGAAVLAFRRMAGLNLRLREAGEDLAELAVTEERLRFARDLHDLLGHSLSLIVLKSELAEQLLASDPERAAGEVRDIKQVARRSLAEVREAVSGYRRVTLATELAGARIALDTAGIEHTIEDPPAFHQGERSNAVRARPAAPEGLPDAVDEVLGWAVREGVTNVVRHSNATACQVRFTLEGEPAERVAVEILDNGDTATPASFTAFKGGSGLAGLAERAAEHGGRLQAGPLPTAKGGFRLRVELPLSGTGTPTPRRPQPQAQAEPAVPEVEEAPQ
jgi:two-component system sensor histidine kinase DesK